MNDDEFNLIAAREMAAIGPDAAVQFMAEAIKVVELAGFRVGLGLDAMTSSLALVIADKNVKPGPGPHEVWSVFITTPEETRGMWGAMTRVLGN